MNLKSRKQMRDDYETFEHKSPCVVLAADTSHHEGDDLKTKRLTQEYAEYLETMVFFKNLEIQRLRCIEKKYEKAIHSLSLVS